MWVPLGVHEYVLGSSTGDGCYHTIQGLLDGLGHVFGFPEHMQSESGIAFAAKSTQQWETLGTFAGSFMPCPVSSPGSRCHRPLVWTQKKNWKRQLTRQLMFSFHQSTLKKGNLVSEYGNFLEGASHLNKLLSYKIGDEGKRSRMAVRDPNHMMKPSHFTFFLSPSIPRRLDHWNLRVTKKVWGGSLATPTW